MLDSYLEFIVQCLYTGSSKSKTVKAIYEQGYDGGTTNANGFVEGTNNKLKMVKRTMYGRCNFPLLRTKMML